ncbi:MAG: universal stress protein [Chloroflexi bacterium]|nr:universal stress protein [Chloroflexota bacterium]
MLDPKKILVPVNGGPVDATVVALASQLAKPAKSRVYAIYVIEVRRTLPLDADMPTERHEADVVLDQVEHTAGELDQEIETEILQARDIGTAIVEEAVEANVDLILMGIPYRRKFGEFDLGRTVPYVLKNAPCEVWVCREALGGRNSTK